MMAIMRAGAAARQDVAGRQELLQAFVVAEPGGVAFFVRVRRKRRLGKVLVFGDAGGLARVRALPSSGSPCPLQLADRSAVARRVNVLERVAEAKTPR